MTDPASCVGLWVGVFLGGCIHTELPGGLAMGATGAPPQEAGGRVQRRAVKETASLPCGGSGTAWRAVRAVRGQNPTTRYLAP